MFYRFMGNYREQLWFASPNLCGAFLCMTLLASFGIWMFGTKIKHKGWKIVFYLSLGLAILFQMLLLAETYSRGGYVAFFAGLLVAFLISRRFILLGFGALQLLWIALTANGVDRLKTISDIAEGSIRNRFLAWRGGMGLIADSPWTGIPHPGIAYHGYFQPLWLNEHYGSLVNEYLHAAVEYGLYVPAGILGILTFLLLWDARTIIKNGRQNGFGACMIGGCVTFIVAGFFSNIWRYSENGYLLLFCLGCCTVPTIVLAFRHRSNGAQISLIVGVLAALLPALAIYIQGCRELKNAGYHSVNAHELFLATPAHMVPNERKAALIVLVDPESITPDSKADQLRELIRPLLPYGIEVFPLNAENGIDDIAPLAEKFHDVAKQLPPGTPLWLAGTGTNLRQGLLAAAEPNAPKLVGILADDTIPVEWPFEELDLTAQKAKLTVPLTIFHAEPSVPAGLEKLKALYEENQTPFRTLHQTAPFFPLGDQQGSIILSGRLAEE